MPFAIFWSRKFRETASIFFHSERKINKYEIPVGIWQHYSNLQLWQMALLFQILFGQKEDLWLKKINETF